MKDTVVDSYIEFLLVEQIQLFRYLKKYCNVLGMEIHQFRP